jgi:hypothetical protein
MFGGTRLGFTHKHSALQRNILIPKYYDPTILTRLRALSETHQLISLGDLVDEGDFVTQQGHDIGKHTYGGPIPYIRTSDLANWEIVSTPKQGVYEEVHHQYQAKQNVAPGDVLMVRDGTYLIGTSALVTDADLPLLYQSHLLRFRPTSNARISGPLLIVLLSSPIVRRQIRAKQFTAGIIDKLEDRYKELILPLPKDPSFVQELGREAEQLIKRRVEFREKLRRIPLWAQGIFDFKPEDLSRAWAERFDSLQRMGFVQRSSGIRTNVFIPKYYDPSIREELALLEPQFELRTIAELVSSGLLQVDTGVEVGKLAYGTGPVPFVRTSDLSNWELKGEPKQRVAVELYEHLRSRTDVRPYDIFLVRDGTFLVGTSAIVVPSDQQLLYAGGLYKVRATDFARLDPYLLLALLNSPIVKRQIRAKQFTRDIIDTLGKRLFEVVVPIPRSPRRRESLASLTRAVVEERAQLRDRAKELALAVEGAEQLDEEERELVDEIAL